MNQSDATLLCDVTNKMQLYYTTYVFMVQDRAFTPNAIVVLAVDTFLIWQSKGKEVSDPD